MWNKINILPEDLVKNPDWKIPVKVKLNDGKVYKTNRYRFMGGWHWCYPTPDSSMNKTKIIKWKIIKNQ